VHACSILNLEFPVTCQNDASEFFEKLVDAIDEAFKRLSPMVRSPFFYSLIITPLFSDPFVSGFLIAIRHKWLSFEILKALKANTNRFESAPFVFYV